MSRRSPTSGQDALRSRIRLRIAAEAPCSQPLWSPRRSGHPECRPSIARRRVASRRRSTTSPARRWASGISTETASRTSLRSATAARSVARRGAPGKCRRHLPGAHRHAPEQLPVRGFDGHGRLRPDGRTPRPRRRGPVAPRTGGRHVRQPVSVVGSQSVAVTDIDGDGNLDIVGADTFIDVVLGDGHGGFSAPFRTPAWSSDIAIGDVDGDGIPDAVGARSVGGSVYDTLVYYPGRGDGTFNPSITIAQVSGPDSLHDVHLADLDGNGHLDVLALKGFTVVAALGHENGAFRDPPRRQLRSAGSHPRRCRGLRRRWAARPGNHRGRRLAGHDLRLALLILRGTGAGAFANTGAYAIGTETMA